ncbi:endonuclease/exonuclease/phosphatase family protein [Rhodobacterales bacterium HKCCE4037]|nr:endonuclease/exonuclease/phosphatase family protein [Rhodobacterales bacterium HKCCE4037]
MDVPSPQPPDARNGDDPGRAHDPGPTGKADRRGRRGRAEIGLALLIALGVAAPAADAETLRLATYHTDLSGRGPGEILHDILRLADRPAATIEVIVAANADIIALQDIDYDAGGATLTALRDALAARGLDYPHHVSLRPNSGWPTGHDLDGDGSSAGPTDAHGYGRFNGDGGMALLSRYPIGEVRDFSGVLWRDLPGNHAADVTPADALSVLRLHSVAAWDVEILTPDGPFRVLTSHASAPVFDGPEDRNGLRNADEIRFWQMYIEGDWSPDGAGPAAGPFALMGTLNVDPERGEGRREVVQQLLALDRLQDPRPEGAGGLATADWNDPTPGDLRVDYILPSSDLSVIESAVLWPEEGALTEDATTASDHRLVWVDIDLNG